MIVGGEGEKMDIGPFTFDTLIIENIINKIISLVLVLVLMYLTIKLGNKIIDKFVKRQIKSNARFSMDSQKAKTIGEVLKSLLKYMVNFIGIAIIVGNLFSNMSVAVAGIGTFTVGLAAQNLIKDIINGFFILFEDQFGIGDHVTLENFEGIVESIGIRTTTIRDFNGDIHLIPNGTITIVTNHSRGNIRFMVDVDIAYEENVDNAIESIKKVCKEFEKNNKEVTEPIEVLGINSLNASSVTIRVIGKSKPLSQWKMERELRKLIKAELDKEGIEIPYPKTEIIKL
ncbi:MAG: mechanosensitive ion channel family protein [Clostridiales bacterium]|nr:mechanosensitive ion channel family protein [Clostridiales bacterium]